MITAICMNPSFDRTVEVEALTLGGLNRIDTSREDVGGKGINVAVVAKRLGLDARCIGVAGQDGLEKINAALQAEGIASGFMAVPGCVRTNTKIVSRDGSGVTELNERGTPLAPESLKAFFDLAREKAQDSEYMVITGSLPPGCPVGTYRDMMKSLGSVPCVLDVGGEELNLAAETKPLIIKPNLQELEDAVGADLRTMRAIRDAARSFIRRGVGHVIASMGSLGAMYVSESVSLFAPAMKVDVKSTVGAGDAMVGGLLKGLRIERNMVRAFRYAVAAGTASVMTEGTQLLIPSDFTNLLEQVRVQEV